MPTPKLQHYATAVASPLTWQVVTPPAPTNRALVVSKLAVSADGLASGPALIYLACAANTAAVGQTASTAPGAAYHFVRALVMNSGDLYSETNLVAVAGESFMIYVDKQTNATFTVQATAMGQELDN